jgi:hypothetical protein
VHIIQRGNNRQACFFADEDYLFFLEHPGSDPSENTGDDIRVTG